MRRLHRGKHLRLLLAALVALLSFGPGSTYVHSHAEGGQHHAHGDHGDGHHDDHDEVPSVSDGVAHVHGSWFGVVFTYPASGGGEGPSPSTSFDSCPMPKAALSSGLFGPLKERIPWPAGLSPPEPSHLPALAVHPSPNPLVLGAGTSPADFGRTVVLRC